MKRNKTMQAFFKRSAQAGSTLIETAVASALMLIVSAGVMALATTAVTTTENQGHLLARTAEYSQDKMEQLMALAYCDSSSDTTQIPTAATGGDGLAGCPVPLVSPATGTGLGGGLSFTSPVSGYVDYLDKTGKLMSSAGGVPLGWFYMRVWQISAGPGGIDQMKQITVSTEVSNEVGSGGSTPQSTLTCLKSYPF